MMKHLLAILIIYSTALVSIDAQAQQPTTGTDFLFGFNNANYDQVIVSSLFAIVSNQNPTPANITITSAFGPFTPVNTVVPAMTVLQIPIVPESIQIQYRATGVTLDLLFVSTEGIRLTSNVPVMLYAHIEGSTGENADSFLVFPTNLLGMRYRAVTCSLLADVGTINSNIIGVIALQDNTQVQIGPQAATINALNTVSLSSKGRLSGFLITADKPIAVVSGCVLGKNSGVDDDANYQTTMLLPTSMWSTQFMAVPFSGITNNWYQISADTDGTVITYPGGGQQGLDTGGWTEFNAPSGMINSNFPIQLIQLGQQTGSAPNQLGSPFFLRVPSVDMMSNADVLIMPTGFIDNINNPPRYMLRVYTNQASIGTIAIDGTLINPLLYQRVSQVDPNYYMYEMTTTQLATHSISTNTSTSIFAVTSYTYKFEEGCGFFPTMVVPMAAGK